MEDGIAGIEGDGPVDLLGGEQARARRACEPVENGKLPVELGVREIRFDAFLEVGDIPPYFAFCLYGDRFDKIVFFHGALSFGTKRASA